MQDYNNVERILKKYFYIYGKYTIHPDGTVDVDSSVVSSFDATKWENKGHLPIQFGKVNGNFNCTFNNIKSLKGVPHTVTGDFDCSGNQLTSLQYAPQSVGGKFDCGSNLLTTLEGAPQIVKGDFICSFNKKFTSLNGLPQTINGQFSFNYNEDLGLLKLIANDIKSIDMWRVPPDVKNIIEKYREMSNEVSTQGQRNALAVRCAAELIRAGYRNNARL